MNRAIESDLNDFYTRGLAVVGSRARYVIAFVMGALSVLSLAPFFLWPVLFLTFTILLITLEAELADDRKSQGFFGTVYFRAGAIGWFFGFGYFIAGLYWFANAFLVEADRFALLIPLAVLAMPAFLSIFYGLAIIPVCLVAGHAARFFALALGLGVAEWLRGHILTGFPWNAIGYGMAANDGMLQLASLFGVYGLNFLAVLLFASPFLLIRKNRFVFIVIALVFAVGVSWGYYRLGVLREPSYVEDVRLRLVQPNIPQRKKMDFAYVPWNFNELIRYSKSGNGNDNLDGVTHVIWPEVAVRLRLAEEPLALEEISKLLPENVSLITGALRREKSANGDKYFNSLMVFDDKAKLKATYDKIHLVPFGEYLPLQWVLESIGLEQLTRQKGGFTAGDGTQWVNASGLPPFSPLICYEVVFPDNVYQSGKRPKWLLNITNDAWFGDSTAPYQHFHQARVRAVEEGLPVVRVANTGVSGVIDPYGVVLQKLPLGKGGIIDHKLPKEIPVTYYGWWRLFVFPFFVLAGLLLMVVSNKRIN